MRPILARGLRGHGRVEAGVDHEVPRRRMRDEEGGARDGPPFRARRADPEHADPAEPLAARPLEELLRLRHATDLESLDGDGRPLAAAAREGSVQRALMGLHLHGRAGYSRHMLPLLMPEASRIFAPDLLAGQVCVVSGSGSGLGRATALELGRLGATVVGCGRRPEPIEATATAIRELGGTARRRGDGHPRRGGRGRAVRPDHRAPRPGRRARQQRRRAVPEPGRGDQHRRAFAP